VDNQKISEVDIEIFNDWFESIFYWRSRKEERDGITAARRFSYFITAQLILVLFSNKPVKLILLSLCFCRRTSRINYSLLTVVQ
jgi:hypothetical protein